jgi:hypothetical protein
MWLKVLAVVLIVLIAGLGSALVYGDRQWRAATEARITRLNAYRLTPSRLSFDDTETEGLPDPVKRYFRRVLRKGQPPVAGVSLKEQGEFRMGEAEDSWRPMTATQVLSARPAGFVWDARIQMAPHVPVHVRDAYLAGAGSMLGKVLGLVPVLDVHDTPEMAAGALQRYLAEAVWFPTALLPSQGVQWAPVNESSARATLTDGKTAVSLEFRFNAEGEITGAFAQSRYREVKGAFQPTPWGSRCAKYAERGGMRIPLEGEVEWRLPDGSLPYWRARITEISYEFTQ